MKKTFLEIQNEIYNLLGKTVSDTDGRSSTLLTSIKLRVNLVQSEIEDSYSHAGVYPFWLKNTKRFATVAEYTTGTVSITKDTKALVGVGTTFTQDFVGRKFYIEDDDHDFEYEIASFTDTTHLTLKYDYLGTTVSGGSYVIFKDTYRLTRNFKVLATVFNLSDNNEMSVITKERMMEGFNDGSFDRKETDTPVRLALWDLTEDTYYSTGTVAVTSASAAIVGTNTVWTSDMIGMTFRVNGTSREYEISTVTDGTHLTIDAVYEGTTNATATYAIDPPGVQLVRLHRPPDEAQQIEYGYIYRLPMLVGNNDVSRIPDHKALIYGAYWQLVLYDGMNGSMDEPTAKRNYNSALSDLGNIANKADVDMHCGVYYK